MAKITPGKLKRSNQISIKDSRTGDIKGTIYTKDTQFGSPNNEIKDNPNLTTFGILRSPGGISGSLQQLTDGRSYLTAGDGVTILSGANGQINISVGSISPADTLTMGNGFTPYGSSYNGTESTSVNILAQTNKGIGVSSSGLKLDTSNLPTAFSINHGWSIIVSNGADVEKTSVNSLLNLGVNSDVTLNNPLQINSSGGIRDTLGSSQYNNTAIVDLALKLESNMGLNVSSAGLKLDPSNLTQAPLESGDKVLIGDISSGDSIKYVTAQDIADLSPAGSLASPLSIGDGLDPAGSTFDGSSPLTISVKSSDSTLTIGSAGISVEKVPNSLEMGNGLSGNNFDGSAQVVAEVAIAPSRGVQVSTAGIELDLPSLPFSQPTAGDYMVFYDVALSEERKNTFGTFMNNIVQPAINATANLGTPCDLTEGTGISSFSFNGSQAGDEVSIDQSLVPMLANDNIYTGRAEFSEGLSGSLTQLSDGTSYLIAGNNVSIMSASNGQVTISAESDAGIISGSISGVSQNFPGVVTTAEDHNLSEKQGVTIVSVAGMSELNGNKYYADVLSANSFSLFEDEDLISPLDTLVFNPYISGGKFTAQTGGNVKSNAPFITWGTDPDLINERVISGSSGISIKNSGDDKIILETDPKKILYFCTETLPAYTDLLVPGINFSENKKSWNKTDVFLNGALLLSGTDRDYVLGQGDSDISFSFDLHEDDSLLFKLN